MIVIWCLTRFLHIAIFSSSWARSIQPKFQPVRPGKEDHLKRWPVFSKLFRLDRTDPLSFGPKFPEILVEWIAPRISLWSLLIDLHLSFFTWKNYQTFEQMISILKRLKACLPWLHVLEKYRAIQFGMFSHFSPSNMAT